MQGGKIPTDAKSVRFWRDPRISPAADRDAPRRPWQPKDPEKSYREGRSGNFNDHHHPPRVRKSD